MNHTIECGKHTIEITNPTKLLFPKITKWDLCNYYAQVAVHMIPLVKNRPMMLRRYPDGIFGESFYQKNIGEHFPDWITQIDIPKEGGVTHFPICQDQATLVYLANQATITPHVWLAKVPNLHHPDQMIFDLDPSTDDFSMVVKGALLLHELLDMCNLISFVKLTGSRGLHVVVPLDGKSEFKEVKHFAQQVARVLIQQHPDNFTLELKKDKREDKVFIDTLRNEFGATAVAPYAVRAYPEAPLAVPVAWQELSRKTFKPRMYTIKNIFKRLAIISDPWEGIFQHKQSLKKAEKKITTL